MFLRSCFHLQGKDFTLQPISTWGHHHGKSSTGKHKTWASRDDFNPQFKTSAPWTITTKNSWYKLTNWLTIQLTTYLPTYLTDHLHGAESFLRSKVTKLGKKFSILHGIWRLILCSKGPTTSPYPESDVSSSHFPTLLPNIHSNIIFPTIPRSYGLLLSGFTTKTMSASHLFHACLIWAP